MEHLTAFTVQRMYKYAGQSVCSLKATILLSAYRAEISEEKGCQLDTRSPNPDLCSHTMGLAVAGETVLLLKLSGLSDAQKADVMDAAYDTRGSFWPCSGEDDGDQHPQKTRR